MCVCVVCVYVCVYARVHTFLQSGDWRSLEGRIIEPELGALLAQDRKRELGTEGVVSMLDHRAKVRRKKRDETDTRQEAEMTVCIRRQSWWGQGACRGGGLRC